MTYVIITLMSPTLDGDFMEKWIYTQPLRVFDEGDDCIGVIHHDKSYWFDRKYIDRGI